MVLQRWRVEFWEIISLKPNAIENWEMELTAGATKLNRGNTPKTYLSERLVFFIVMMPLNKVSRKFGRRGYKFTRSHDWSQNMVYHLIYRDDIKVFAEKEKEIENLLWTIRIGSRDIEMEFEIEKCSMLILKSEKRITVEGVELLNEESIRTLGGMGNYLYWEY